MSVVLREQGNGASKLDITRELVKQFDLWTIEDAMRAWWQTTNEGWRLTHVGFDAFEQCELEHWDYEIPPASRTQPMVLLTLDRRITRPYYIKAGKHPQLCFFDSKEAMLYALYGDINKFISNLKLY